MKTEMHPKRFRRQYPNDPEQLRETQPARGLPVPRQPSQHEREEHELTHLPFRAWCKTCVAAKARQAYHTKQPNRRDCLQLDFGFLTEGNRQDAVLVVTDARTGSCAALLCETKHTTEMLIRFVLSFIYETGRTHTPIQTDDEEATKALAKAVSRRIGIPTFTSPAYSSGSPWSDRAMHTDTLGTASNLTNTGGRQIFEVANHNDSSDCRLGHSTCFLDSDTILATC